MHLTKTNDRQLYRDKSYLSSQISISVLDHTPYLPNFTSCDFYLCPINVVTFYLLVFNAKYSCLYALVVYFLLMFELELCHQ